ncbi:unnamed protein product [Euphydryas editha]|uniref:Endonuclease/exonuclease/phosphatase domain-containing protein n=1 Tax=Euphydryas editha TaxID=104508 RepID=A0AAU9V5P7_EUPED|nr:unnamed protein product [Euphydryas editha]
MDKLTLDVGIIYRPGDTRIKNFMDLFSTQLERRKRAIIFGDFNIDLLSTNNYVIEYMNRLEETGFQIINKIDRKFSTHGTSTTSTILDHVYTNINNHSFNMSIIDSSLSDHKQIFLQIGTLAPQITKKIRYEALNYEDLYVNALKADYCNKTKEYHYLEKFILEHINNNKINKTKFLNVPQKDWINKEIINSIDMRNRLWQETKANPNNENLKKQYDEERKKTMNLIRTRKKDYYYSLFSTSSNNPKKMWKTINSLALNKSKESCAPLKLILDSGPVTEGNAVCSCFNDFFSSIGLELASKIMYDCNYRHDIMLKELAPYSSEEVSNIIDNLDSNTSTGIDGISTKAIKCIKDVISQRLADCINKCVKVERCRQTRRHLSRFAKDCEN